MKLCRESMLSLAASINERMSEEETPCASGRLRGRSAHTGHARTQVRTSPPIDLMDNFVCSDPMATSRSTSRNLPHRPGAPHTQTGANSLLIYAMADDRSQQGHAT